MITLTTDFGASEYVGAMKGVIYSINPQALVVDITHNIKPFDIRHGAYVVYSTFSYFPKRTVHIAVVDPGVGTKRKGIIIESEDYLFVGPDNGVFSLIDGERIFEITESGSSATFHGRDIFAPVAARLDGGASPKELGREVKEYIKTMKKEVEAAYIIKGEVFCADLFGNIITSIKEEHLKNAGVARGDEANVLIDRRKLKVPLVMTYGDLKEGELGALINSAGHFEVTVRKGSAEDRLGVRGGESVEVFP